MSVAFIGVVAILAVLTATAKKTAAALIMLSILIVVSNPVLIPVMLSAIWLFTVWFLVDTMVIKDTREHGALQFDLVFMLMAYVVLGPLAIKLTWDMLGERVPFSLVWSFGKFAVLAMSS